MFSHLPEQSVALTIFWIWLGIVAAVAVGWWLHKKCRAPDPPPQLPYAQSLKRRLNKHPGTTDGTRKRHRK